MKFAIGILTIYYSLLAFFPHIHQCELREITALYEHYLEHLEADGDSFLEFIYEDFLSDVGDKEHHNKQPISDMPIHNHSTQSHCCNFIPLAINGYELSKPQSESSQDFGSYSFNYSFLFLNSIFQPPRI